MMDYTAQQSPEHILVQRVVGASIQLQKEEGFSILEEQQIARSLGINWYQATTFKQAGERLNGFLKDHKTEPTKEVALVNALKVMLSELLPNLFILGLSEDIEAYMPDEDSILIRLRHRFFMEINYQDEYLVPRLAERSLKSGTPVHHSHNSFGIELWLRNVESAILLVLNEFGLNRRYVNNVLSNDVNQLLSDQSIDQRQRLLLSKLGVAVKSVQEELKEDYEKKSAYVRPSQLGVFTPTVADIARLIRSYIDESGVSENCVQEEPAPVPKRDLEQVLKEMIINAGGR
ncbi:hypothetical protein [Maridesulfovibrio sp.]|uniref:hypothetical protein n=1 Tax=Maridesulfovibrio sp. TaxID=2795000 RepID=UPI0039EF1BDF